MKTKVGGFEEMVKVQYDTEMDGYMLLGCDTGLEYGLFDTKQDAEAELVVLGNCKCYWCA